MSPHTDAPPSAVPGICSCKRGRQDGWTRAEGGEWVCDRCHRKGY